MSLKQKPFTKQSQFYIENIKRLFNSRDECFQFLENDVFRTIDFERHITETAKTLDIGYQLAYEIITNYLTDVLYEVDKVLEAPRKKRRISVYSYFYLDTGFLRNLKNLIFKTKKR